MKDIIVTLKSNSKTISTMESCTGGYIANKITDNEGVSEVFKFSAVTYSNAFKIKMGVDAKLIKKYTVYSKEVAMSMAKTISELSGSDYGIGVTGKLKRTDENNPDSKNDIVYVSIYSINDDKYYNLKIKVTKSTREENKEMVYNEIVKELKKVIK
jgi:nicotinamide-nucleotide amidase